MKKTLVFLLCFTLVLGASFSAAAAQQDPLQAAVSCYEQQKALTSWWDIVALSGAGVTVLDGGYKLPALPMSEITAAPSPTGYAGRIFAALALNQDPHSFYMSVDLVRALESMQGTDGAFGDYPNQHIFALLALEAAGGEYDKASAERFLLSFQESDGGFGYEDGMGGDVDLTGMALMALSLYDDEAAQAAIASAEDFLLAARGEDGGYVSVWSSTGQPNSCSAAAVISGLVSIGVDVTQGEWAKTYENLLSMQTESGAFVYEPGNDAADAYSTQQALVALGDIAAGDSVFKRLQYDGAAEKLLTFDDTDQIGVWAKSSVRQMCRAELMRGDTLNRFMPDGVLTYAQLAVILGRLMPDTDIPVNAATISGVDGTQWYAQDFAHVKATGGVWEISPSHALSRGAFAYTIAKMCGLQEGETIAADMADYPEEEITEAVSAVMSAGLMEGYPDGRFAPDRLITRQEAAKVISLLLQEINA